MCYVYDVMASNFISPMVCSRPSHVCFYFVACLLIFDVHDCVHCLRACFLFTFKRPTIRCVRTHAVMLDFCLFWHSIVGAEALRDASVFLSR
jgi:hypothetical protein